MAVFCVQNTPADAATEYPVLLGFKFGSVCSYASFSSDIPPINVCKSHMSISVNWYYTCDYVTYDIKMEYVFLCMCCPVNIYMRYFIAIFIDLTMHHLGLSYCRPIKPKPRITDDLT